MSERLPARRGESLVAGAERGELVSGAEELVDDFVLTLAAQPQTQATYERACRRFARWLGPGAGPEDLTLATLSAYQDELTERGLSTQTVRKDRAALNTWLRFLAEHELIEPRQARLALAAKLPRAAIEERERPRALSDDQYGELVRQAEATVARDELMGWRDVALVRVLGEAGLRCEELVRLERRDFMAARRGARLRALEVRHGKGDRRRRVRLTPKATSALRRWDKLRRERLGPPPATSPRTGRADPRAADPERWPLFVTLGRRRRDGAYTRAGNEITHALVDDLLKRLGRRAKIPAELRHAHVLRHTFATRFMRTPGADLATLRKLLGHQDPKTTMVYVQVDDAHVERQVLRFAGGGLAIEEDEDLEEAA